MAGEAAVLEEGGEEGGGGDGDKEAHLWTRDGRADNYAMGGVLGGKMKTGRSRARFCGGIGGVEEE